MVVRRLFDLSAPSGTRLGGRSPGNLPPGPVPGDRVEDDGPRAVYAGLPASPTGGALSRIDPRLGGPRGGATGGGDRAKPLPFDRAKPLPFEWTLNPYRGCEIACGYCYARYTHGFLGLDDPLDFERRIFGKEDLPRLLARDLERRVAPGQRIAVGTATDPWQPVEREKEITRGCLRVFARHRGLRLSFTTKSDLVLRDLDLLRVVARRSSLHVNLTVTTLDRRLARALEPRAPTPPRRLQAVRALAAEGIETGVFLMPVLPGLTDGPGMIEDLAAAAAAAGARYLCHQVVFLREPTRTFWRDQLRARWPALVPRYARWFAGGAYAGEDLREAVARRVARARRRHGLAGGPSDRAPADPQLSLAFMG
jgi:DNA repair photolyase